MSASGIERGRAGEAVAGLIAAGCIFVSLIALVYRPLRIAPATLAISLVAAGFGGRHRHLAAAAVTVATACWVAGMTIAVLRGDPLY